MSFLGGFFDTLFGNNDYGSQGVTSTGGAGPSGATQTNATNQQNAATSFRANLPGYINTQSGIDAENTSKQAQSGDFSINAANSKRGLLYSGINEGEKSANRSNLASGLMNRRAQLNSQGQQMASAYDTQAANAGIGMAQMQQNANNQIYQGNKAGSNQTPGLIGGILNGI